MIKSFVPFCSAQDGESTDMNCLRTLQKWQKVEETLSKNQNGEPKTKTENQQPKRRTKNQNGDPKTKLEYQKPKWRSKNQNGDLKTKNGEPKTKTESQKPKRRAKNQNEEPMVFEQILPFAIWAKHLALYIGRFAILS